ncbi:DsbA family protein [Lentzea sp. BCCO 10_0856]|uniref:DsbA family protein n=1 Tax=Lentzea miocenica TaxID=3095431 RepID=A0ABU4SYX8_9PSEU|nr:DsbA family protein [Lentzea sp. BCCO 10_0856]MDX8031078.1 DsbA family protein [Lentzea sp. BCCO 10_0856]
MKLVYVFDACCGWSHAFSGTLEEVIARHPELPVEVVSGGLFTGARRVPIREYGFIKGANAQITARTGVTFGAAFDALIADGSFVMDSEAAARGLIALRQFAPDRAAELAVAMQKAFFHDGLSLSNAKTYRMIADAFGIDSDAVVGAFKNAEHEADFNRAAQLGVSSFPTLLAVQGNKAFALARGHSTADEIEKRLTALL